MWKIEQYETIARVLGTLANHFAQERINQRQATDVIIRKINTRREERLLPLKAALYKARNKAQEAKDGQLANPDRRKSDDEIERKYQQAIDGYQLTYESGIAPIHLYFDEKVEEANEQL